MQNFKEYLLAEAKAKVLTYDEFVALFKGLKKDAGQIKVEEAIALTSTQFRGKSQTARAAGLNGKLTGFEGAPKVLKMTDRYADDQGRVETIKFTIG